MTSSFSSPERRSAADLQRILDSLIGESGFVLSAHLPDVLAAYETKHDLVILDPTEYTGLKELCSQHGDLELGPKELFQFLAAIPKPQPQRPISPTPSTLPPSSFNDSTPTQNKSHRRRNSDRIRSPSDSSSSSEDEPRYNRQSSAPASSKPFPSSGHAPSYQNRPLPPKRTKTLSDPSRLDSPLAVRARNAQGPPSAYGNVGFARPSPAGRRSRKTSGTSVGLSDQEARSPPFETPFKRSTSSASVHEPEPFSPTELDSTSFHERAKSPDVVDGQVDVTSEVGSDGNEEVDEVDTSIGNDSLNPRLSRISTESAASLRTSHDKLRALQKQNAELGRKLKESERQLAISGAENDRLVQDLQDRLEEAQAEIAQRKKEDKDMKGKDRTQLIAIAGFEADISSLQRSLENSKSNHASMQKMYNAQCDEAQRLRDMLRDRDAEIRDYEESTRTHEADEEKYTREIETLEAEIKRLESDLSIARQAESVLDVQKQENLQLKETIDRMKFEMDEAKAAVGGGYHLRGGTTTSSGPQTMSRNLGDELSRRLLEAEEEEDSVVETVVTRTRKLGGRSARLDDDREYADAWTETDPVSEPTTPTLKSVSKEPPLPPAYTPNPEPINAQEVLDKAHSREHPRGDEAVDDEYQALVDALGMRCQVLEDEIKSRQVERAKRGVPTQSHTRRLASGKPGIVNYIYHSHNGLPEQIGKFAVWSIAVFAIGIMAGSHMLNNGLHPRDQQLWTAMNSLAMATGAGEGFLPVNNGVLAFVEHGARMVAGRVPT